MALGTPSIRLAPDGVHIEPGPWQRRRGATSHLLPYAATDSVSLRFGSGQVAEMHQVATELWQRIRRTQDLE